MKFGVSCLCGSNKTDRVRGNLVYDYRAICDNSDVSASFLQRVLRNFYETGLTKFSTKGKQV